jgi:hypothetical protein
VLVAVTSSINVIVVSVQSVGTAAIAASRVAYHTSQILATSSAILTPPSQSPAKKIANKLSKSLFFIIVRLEKIKNLLKIKSTITYN